MLKGEAKAAYMREYWKRKRAEKQATDPKPQESGRVPELEAEVTALKAEIAALKKEQRRALQASRSPAKAHSLRGLTA